VVDAPATAADGLVETWADMRARVRRFAEWRRRLVDEMAQLPDTMRRLREGVAQFELVGERLANSTAALEGISDLYESTLAESGRRSAHAVEVLRSQVEALARQTVSPDRMASSMNEMQRALETIADLNPFWPKPSRDR
jgi:methyl-accepting chemotaxis protein